MVNPCVKECHSIYTTIFLLLNILTALLRRDALSNTILNVEPSSATTYTNEDKGTCT